MSGRTILRIGLLFPFSIIVLAALAEFSFWGVGNTHWQLVGPPIIFGYSLLIFWSWHRLNLCTTFRQACTHLLLSPLVFGLLMSISLASYFLALGLQNTNNLIAALTSNTLTFAAAGFAYIAVVSIILGLLYSLKIVREYVPNYAIKGTSV